MEYYERIRAAREDKDITQKEIAEALKTTQGYYSKYELGIRELPLSRLREICLYLGVSADYLLGLPKGLNWPR